MTTLSNDDPSSIDALSVNTIRALSMDAVEQAASGHPGMPMGMADVAYVLWTRFLRFDPEAPQWYGRDRFILSAGHGSMLLYSLLHLSGHELSLEQIRRFRQLGSLTPGHPEYGHTPGVEMTTGPLGQGFATGVGMAMAAKHMASLFDEGELALTDHRIYAIVSDGDLMEGVSHEAASLAGHLKLGNLVYLYDSNRISIDGSTDLAFTDDTAARFRAYGWHVVECDGHDHGQIHAAVTEAVDRDDAPSLVVCRTHIGYGSPNKQDSASSHGAPLGAEEVKASKRQLGLDPDLTFHVPDEARRPFEEAAARGRAQHEAWRERLARSLQERPEATREFQRRIAGERPADWHAALPVFPADAKGMASRKSSGMVLNAISTALPELLGGSADLAGSNNTTLDGAGVFTHDPAVGSWSGRNVHYGVREHAMGAAMNGMALHGGCLPFGGTFLVFADYCRPAIRIAALSGIQSIYVLTHDSIGLGEDGPTHQPIEHLASLRAMPNLQVLRPADANEVAACWKMAIEHAGGPSVLALSRQNLPTLERPAGFTHEHVERGAYVVNEVEPERADLLLLATGSELHLVLEAARRLRDEDGVHAAVISMPSWEAFRRQPAAWRNRVLPPSVTARVSVEAASTFGWREWVGEKGVSVGLDRFGESGPAEELFEKFGFTPEHIREVSLGLLRSRG